MKKHSITLLALLLAAVMTFGCTAASISDADPKEPAQTTEETPTEPSEETTEKGAMTAYKLGVFMRYNDDTGAQMRAVMTKAFENLNAAGGIDGHPVDVVFYDTDGNAENAVNIFNRLVSDDKVLLAIGPTTSTNALAVTDLAVQNGLAIITPQATNTSITSEYANEWFFRNSVADCYQSYSLVDYICGDLGMTKIAFIHSTDSQGQGQFDNFSDYMKEHYNLEVAIEQTFNEDDIDFKSQLLAIKNAEPEVLVIAGHEAEIALITSQRLEVGIDPNLPFAGYNAMTSADYAGVAGESCVGVLIASPWSATATDEASQKFVTEYAEQLTAPDANAALAYDCVNTVVHALTGLELGLTEESLQADRRIIRDALASIQGFQNLTGTVNYGPGATQQDKDAKESCAIWQMQEDYTYTLVKSAN